MAIQDEKTSATLLNNHGLIVWDNVITRIGDMHESDKDNLLGVLVMVYPTTKLLCKCGREDCKGAKLDEPEILVMN